MIANKTSRPDALKVLSEGIPEELKVRPQWVCWRYALDPKGRWTKHPHDPRTGRMASHSDLMTWSPFESVFEAYEGGRYDGVGFVFCSGDPYSGVDLDGCRDPKSAEVEPWAVRIARCLDGHMELSPSGEGLHIFVRGKVPAPLKRGSIEMYSTERYFTVTGHAAGITGEAA